MTPVAHANRAPALSPIGTVLRARRLVRQAANAPKPDEHEMQFDVCRVPAKKSAPYIRQPLRGPPAKKHKSAPSVPSLKGVARAKIGKHQYMGNHALLTHVAHRNKSAPNSEIRFSSVHPHSKLARSATHHRRGVEAGIKRDCHKQPHQVFTTHRPTNSTHVAGCQPVHWENMLHSNKRTRRPPLLRSSAPAQASKVRKLP